MKPQETAARAPELSPRDFHALEVRVVELLDGLSLTDALAVLLVAGDLIRSSTTVDCSTELYAKQKSDLLA
jgi:hypothetical protein